MRILILLMTLVAAFGATTWWALEWSGVAVIETRKPEGDLRSTHVWFAEPHGELWLEAGTPENPWYVDILESPTLSLTRSGRSTRYVARPVTAPSALAGHLRIRALMREKYGLRDRWVGLIADTSQSVAVRLVAAEDE